MSNLFPSMYLKQNQIDDTKNKVMYFHTQHNRRVQMVDLKKIDFDSFDSIKRISFGEKKQDIKDITPKS